MIPDLTLRAMAVIAGTMLGGLAENASLLLGFRYLMVAAAGFYALSAILNPRIGANN
jgi:hypothetical protein